MSLFEQLISIQLDTPLSLALLQYNRGISKIRNECIIKSVHPKDGWKADSFLKNLTSVIANVNPQKRTSVGFSTASSSPEFSSCKEGTEDVEESSNFEMTQESVFNFYKPFNFWCSPSGILIGRLWHCFEKCIKR